MKKYFISLALITFMMTFCSSDWAFSDETRAQFEQSSRAKATAGLLLDEWDNLYLYTWHVGTAENNYLWTNLSNLQKDNVSFDLDGYEWSTDEKENILGRPGWDSNNSYAVGYEGGLPWFETFNVGFMFNYQTSSHENKTDNYSLTSSFAGEDVTDYVSDTWQSSSDAIDEHVWLLSAGRKINDELSWGATWYHWYNDHDIDTDSGTYNATNLNNEPQSFTFNNARNEYDFEERGDTISFGLNWFKEDWAFQTLQAFVDLDFNQTKIEWSKKITSNSTNEGTQTITNGKDLSDFHGNEDRSDFGFDILLRAVRQWDGDIWKKTFVWTWVGFHPEDGDYDADQKVTSYWDYSDEDWGESTVVNYDIDGDVEWDELNLGITTKTFMNFGERVLFAWGVTYEWWDYSIELNYDSVVHAVEIIDGVNKEVSHVTSYWDNADLTKYRWSFPVALEISFLKNLVGRVGAKWTLTDIDRDTSEGSEFDDDNIYGGSSSNYWSDSFDVNTESKSSSTSYSFGLGWRFNEYLQLDLTEFTDLDDMNEWQLSATLIW